MIIKLRPRIPREAAGKLVRLFREKREGEGLSYGSAYNEILAGILLHLGFDAGDADEDPDPILAELFIKKRVKRILDVGCGEGKFLSALEPVSKIAGIELVGVDRERMKYHYPGILNLDIMDYSDEGGFDIILSSGVLSWFGQTPRIDRISGEKRRRYYYRDIMSMLDHVDEILAKCLGLLAPNPASAIFLNTLGSFLVMDKSRVAPYAEILRWERRAMADGFLSMIWERVNDTWGERALNHMLREAPSFAVISRRESPSK